MANLNCIEIIEKDKTGSFAKVGARWNENTGRGIGGRIAIFMAGLIFAAMGGIALYMALQPDNPVSFIGYFMSAILGPPGIGCFAATFRKQPKRSLLFHFNGKIETPFGIPNNKYARIWATKWSDGDIQEIEAVGMKAIQIVGMSILYLPMVTRS